MSKCPSLKIGSGWGKSLGACVELEGIVTYDIIKVDTAYLTLTTPGQVVPQRLLRIVFVPPGTPQDDLYDFYGAPNATANTAGQSSLWTVHIARKVKGVVVDHSYNVQIIQTRLLCAEVSAAEQQSYEVLCSMVQEELRKVQAIRS